jgi:hypothetical protein
MREVKVLGKPYNQQSPQHERPRIRKPERPLGFTAFCHQGFYQCNYVPGLGGVNPVKTIDLRLRAASRFLNTSSQFTPTSMHCGLAQPGPHATDRLTYVEP